MPPTRKAKIASNDTTPIDLTDLSFTPTGKIRRALDEQHSIGWLNFYRGRISTTWLAAQHDHAKLNTNQAEQDTTQWASQIITTLWHGFLQLWEERKQDQHGRDTIQQSDKLRKNLLKKIDLLYANLHTYDNEDKRFFSKPVTNWEQASNKDIQDWLTIAEPLADKSAYRAYTRLSRDQPIITQFFRATTRETIQHHDNTHNMRPPRTNREG